MRSNRWTAILGKEHSFLTRYLVAGGIIAALFALNVATPYSPNAGLMIACVTIFSSLIAALVGGMNPGIVVGLLGFLIADYYFVEPIGTLLADPRTISSLHPICLSLWSSAGWRRP